MRMVGIQDCGIVTSSKSTIINMCNPEENCCCEIGFEQPCTGTQILGSQIYIRKMMMDRHKNDPKIDYWDAKRYTLDSNRLALTSLNAGCLSGRLCSLIVLGAVERWSLLRKGNIIAWSYGNLDM